MRQIEEQLLLLVLLLPSCSSEFGDVEGTIALKVESKRSPEKALAEKHYVFGFTTGYVGSTTLSSAKTYKNGKARSRMIFEFERYHRINPKIYHHTHDDENNTYW
jgi:hypothetical protein